MDTDRNVDIRRYDGQHHDQVEQARVGCLFVSLYLVQLCLDLLLFPISIYSNFAPRISQILTFLNLRLSTTRSKLNSKKQTTISPHRAFV